jgi:hypothetical protein
MGKNVFSKKQFALIGAEAEVPPNLPNNVQKLVKKTPVGLLFFTLLP